MPVREPRTFSRIKRNHMHALRMDTGKAFKSHVVTEAAPPRLVRGTRKFFNVPHLPITAYIAATAMFTKLPAFRNAKIACHQVGAAPRASSSAFSAVCGELASNGFVVVAMEHQDGSGARSYVNIPANGKLATGSQIDSTNSRPYYKVDYIFPRDNAQDTSPHSARGVDIELRHAQIQMRMSEIEEVYYILELLNNGQGDFIYKIMGHSFGGATIVEIVRESDRFPYVGQGILLDAWGQATPKAGEVSHQSLRKPLLAINSEAFMHWPENFKRLSDIAKEARDGGACC
ncbi:hypothetical protein M434DRAFT_35962 [Hypoxylon sp. CO27-5]|nr:hypothetical protein M434DRAFT_35962 [Hypoxylon sp. CO27-5]